MKFYIGVSCNKISFSRVFAPTHQAISRDSLREGEAGIEEKEMAAYQPFLAPQQPLLAHT